MPHVQKGSENKKQTIRFYCFFACEEELRAAAGDVASAAGAATATTIAGRKQQAGSRKSCHCKQGRCSTCQNEQLLCKNVAELTWTGGPVEMGNGSGRSKCQIPQKMPGPLFFKLPRSPLASRLSSGPKVFRLRCTICYLLKIPRLAYDNGWHPWHHGVFFGAAP